MGNKLRPSVVRYIFHILQQIRNQIYIKKFEYNSKIKNITSRLELNKTPALRGKKSSLKGIKLAIVAVCQDIIEHHVFLK